jgi:hypothetical protein
MPESNQISLQSIADEHLRRLLAYRDGAEFSHAAVSMMIPAQLESYQKILPPRIQGVQIATPEQAKRQALLSLGANAIRDIMTLEGILFEELRLCIEIAQLNHKRPSEEERKVESQKILERRPVTLSDGATALDQLLSEGFPRMQEFRSLAKLYYIFAAQACDQPGFKGDSPITLLLCTPKITSGDALIDGQFHSFEIESISREFHRADEIPFDPRMNYEVFFTAYSLYRDLINGCKKTILDKYNSNS